MAAPQIFGAGVLAGCVALLVSHLGQDALEQQSVREMTTHLMGVQRAYAVSMAATSRAAQQQEQREWSTIGESIHQPESVIGAYASSQ